MRAALRPIAAAGVVALLLGSMSCGDVVRQGRSPVLLVVDSVEAASGATPETFAAFLLSDVETLVDQTVGGTTVKVPVVYNDVGQATLRLVMKDQGTAGTGVAPSTLNSVTLNRYRVSFRRADGRNTPGVDIPYTVDGALTATITNTPTVVGFEFVRIQAKLEPPLRSLVNVGGRLFISTIAEVTFYGADLSGNQIQATATISVSFSDYADPK